MTLIWIDFGNAKRVLLAKNQIIIGNIVSKFYLLVEYDPDKANQLLDITLVTKMRHFKTKQELLDYCVKETLKEFEKFVKE